MSENEAENIGEAIGDGIANAINEAQSDAELAEANAKAIADAAMEGERGRRIDDLERRFSEWESNQTDTAEALVALTLGLTEMRGQLSALLTPPPSPTPNLQNVEDGQKENHEPEVEIKVEAPEAAPPEPPAPPVERKKRHRWI